MSKKAPWVSKRGRQIAVGMPCERLIRFNHEDAGSEVFLLTPKQARELHALLEMVVPRE